MKAHVGVGIASLVLVLASCVGTRPLPMGAAAPRFRDRPLFNQDEMQKVRMDVLWQSQIPGKRLQGMALLADAIYVWTDDNLLYAIDVRDGVVRWVFDVGDEVSIAPGVYTYPEASPGDLRKYDEVFVVSKDTLLSVDREIGALHWKVVLPFSPSATPVANRTHVFLGAWDDRIYAIEKETQVIAWRYRTDQDVISSGAEVDPNYYFGSEDGTVYAVNAATGSLKWTFPTLGRITANLLYFREKLYLGGGDFNIYCLNRFDGSEEWRVPMGAPATQSPVAVRHTVYGVNDRNELYAVHRIGGEREDKSRYFKGETKWIYRGGTRVLSRGRDDVYVLDASHALCAIDDESGNLRWKLPLGGVDFVVTNPADPEGVEKAERDASGTIFLGGRGGWVAAFREKPPM